MANQTLSRLAPTPSGHLHLGNIANFLLIEKLVLGSGGRLLLRIDDCDGTRARREFVEHIFETLSWLGIRWQGGPGSASDFYANYSQVSRKAYYFKRLEALSAHTFACACSRKDLEGEGACACWEKRLPFLPGKHAIRLRVEDQGLARTFGSVVLWRKDDGPAYHWASVVDDLDAKVNLIVRGEDLKDTSELQKYIGALVSPCAFQQVKFIHHPLLTDSFGGKLSKSQGAFSVVDLKKSGLGPLELRGQVNAILAGWGF